MPIKLSKIRERRVSKKMSPLIGKNFIFEEGHRSTVKSKLTEFGLKVMSYFAVKRRNLLRTNSQEEEKTNPKYLKLKINHKKKYESDSLDDVLEEKRIMREKFEKNCMEEKMKQTKIFYSLKKNKNHFMNFLRYLSKKKRTSFKPLNQNDEVVNKQIFKHSLS